MGRSDWSFMVVVHVEARRGCCTRKRRDFARDRPATQAPIFGPSASSAFVELSSRRTDPTESMCRDHRNNYDSILFSQLYGFGRQRHALVMRSYATSL